MHEDDLGPQTHRWGPNHTKERRMQQSTVLAGNYMDLQAFQRNAGRALHIATFDPTPDDPHINFFDALKDLHDQGHRKVVIKTRKAKRCLAIVNLPQDREDIASRCIYSQSESLGWTTVHEEGNPGAFLIQEHIPMEHEYRIFVVNHQTISGAGCIERFTPTGRTTRLIFDEQVQNTRRWDAPISEQPETVRSMARFAQRVAQQVKNEAPNLRHYTLDVATTTNDQPVVVELNDIYNSGLYANDANRILEAFRAAETRTIDIRDPDPLADMLNKLED